MNEIIMKKFKREMQLDACLNSIKECCNVAQSYISGECEVYDVDELITALACVPEYTKEIDQIILEMAEEYEKEIEELRNEQL